MGTKVTDKHNERVANRQYDFWRRVSSLCE